MIISYPNAGRNRPVQVFVIGSEYKTLKIGRNL